MPPHLEPTSSDIFREAAIMTYTMADEPAGLETDVDLRRLLDLACDWYWTLDAELRLIRLRGRQLDDGPNFMHAQLGKRPWEWAGVVADAPDLPRLRSALDNRSPFSELTCTMRDAQGQIRHQVLSGEPLYEGDIFTGFHGTTRDLTYQRRTESLIELEHAVTRSLSAASTSRQVLQAVMKVICKAEQWDTAGFFKTVEKTGGAKLIAGWSGPGMAEKARVYYKQHGDKQLPSTGMLGRVIHAREPLWIADLQATQTVWAQRVGATDEHATLFFPVLLDTRVIGVFAFASREVREPDERLLMTLRVVGEQVGQFLKRKEAEQILRESEARFRALTELSSDLYWEMGPDLRLTRVEGREASDADTLPGKRSIGKRFWETGLELGEAGWAAHRLRLEARLPFHDVVMKQTTADGRRRYISISGEPIQDARDGFLGYRGVGRDVSERRNAELRIKHLATHDGLTGLANRVLFASLLEHAIQSSERNQRLLAILFVDLDGFKAINDALGHDAGDALLKETARRLRKAVRSGDIVARLGGDEFVILARHVLVAADVSAIAEKALAAVASPFDFKERTLGVTASVGISLYGVDATDGPSMLKNADVAMYAAKQDGKNAFRFHATASPSRASDG